MTDGFELRATRTGLPRGGLERQLPYAMSLAMNQVGELAMAAVRVEMRQEFTLRVPRFDLPPVPLPRVWRATKTRLALKLAIGDTDGGEGWIGPRRERIFRPHEGGEIRQARDAQFPLFIPTTAIRPTFSSLVPRQLYPTNLRLVPRRLPDNTTLPALRRGKVVTLAGAKISNRARRKLGLEGVGGTFTINGPDGRPIGIFQRTGAGRRDLRMIWLAKQKITIKPRLNYFRTLREVWELRWSDAYAESLAYALRTAR